MEKLMYPSKILCPKCGMNGTVYYIENPKIYLTKCINCNHYIRKDAKATAVLDSHKLT